MGRERDLLEVFYFRAEPLGVTLFGPAFTRPLTVGLPPTSLVSSLDVEAGLMQNHMEHAGVSVCFAKLASREALVAQFSFRELDPSWRTSWLRSVRLATALDLSRDYGQPPEPLHPSPVPRPSPRPSWLPIAHARPDDESA